MRAGNRVYEQPSDIPSEVPIFPLSEALLLPGTHMPLNIFEERYLSMVNDALVGDRLVGMIQPDPHRGDSPGGNDTSPKNRPKSLVPILCEVGCLGRITAFQETDDDRLLISLSGICRFTMLEELPSDSLYRRARISPFLEDLVRGSNVEQVDRQALLKTFGDFLEANKLEADWGEISETDTEALVNSLSMLSPYGAAEKQALLEAPDLKTRAETLIAITEVSLTRGDRPLQ